MDFSQYIRLKQEAANVYVARTRTVDSSFLSLQKNQKAVYAGYNPSSTLPKDNGSCPSEHAFTGGFTSVDKQGVQDYYNMKKAGLAVCNDINYATAPRGIQLKNANEVSTILSEGNIIPGLPRPYGYGLNPSVKDCGNSNPTYFPTVTDTCTPSVYPPAAWPYK